MIKTTKHNCFDYRKKNLTTKCYNSVIVKTFILFGLLLLFFPSYTFGQTPINKTSKIVVVELYSWLSNGRPVYSFVMFNEKETLLELINGDTLNHKVLFDSAKIVFEPYLGFLEIMRKDSTLNSKDFANFMSMLKRMNKRFNKEKRITDGDVGISVSAVEIFATYSFIDRSFRQFIISDSYLNCNDLKSDYIIYLRNIHKIKRVRW